MERLFSVSDAELTDFEAAHYAYIQLLPVMLYPENIAKQEDLVTGYQYHITRDLAQNEESGTPEERQFWQTHARKATQLSLESDRWEKILSSPMESRKKGLLGSLVCRGSLAGQILWHMVKPSHGSLESAYQEIINRHSHNFHDTSELAIPSVPTLKKIWGEYKNVSHFWAAEYLLRNNEWQHYLHLGPLSSVPIQPEAAECFVLFLRIASFFRKKLLDQRKPSTLTPLIPTKDCELVWLVIREDGNIIPPLDLILS